MQQEPRHAARRDPDDSAGLSQPERDAVQQLSTQNRALTQAIADEQRLRQREADLRREADRLLQVLRDAIARYQRTSPAEETTPLPLPLLLAGITAQPRSGQRTPPGPQAPHGAAADRRDAIRALTARVEELRRAVTLLLPADD
ncbi:MAG: hypothetical protein Tsb0020_23050 [Haliangiales bacterium]